MEKESELRKRKHVDTSLNVKELSKEEKEKRVAEMEKKAHILEYQRNLQIEEKNLKNKYESAKNRGSTIDKPKFIKSIENDAYTDGKISLSDRVKRNMSTNIKLDKYDKNY